MVLAFKLAESWYASKRSKTHDNAYEVKQTSMSDYPVTEVQPR